MSNFYDKVKEKIKKGVLIMLNNMRYNILTFLDILPSLMFYAAPYLSMVMVISLYEKRGGFIIGGEWLAPVVLCVIADTLGYIIKSETIAGCPVAAKRYTRRGEYGEVVCDRKEIYEALQYLAEVEDFCERYGKYMR